MNLDETELPEIMFEVTSSLNCEVRMTNEQWEKIRLKHPKLEDKINKIIYCLQKPEILRKSIYDPRTYLNYIKEDQYWLVAIYKKLNGYGFIKTAYITAKIKKGEELWRK